MRPLQLLLLPPLLSPPPCAARAGFGGLILPPVVYGTAGLEGNIYFDNISPSKGKNRAISPRHNLISRDASERWRVIPAGDFEFEISIFSKSASLANESKYHDMGDFVAGSARQQVERLVYHPKTNALSDVVIQVGPRRSLRLLSPLHHLP